MQSLVWLLVLAQSILLAHGQSVSLSTTVFTTTILLPNRVLTTSRGTSVATITIPRSSSAPTSGTASASRPANATATASGNVTASATGNATSGAAPSSTSSTGTPLNLLPTASANSNAGGYSNGAPSPGANVPGGIFGPPDGYISAAMSSIRTRSGAVIFGTTGVLVGGALWLI